MNILLAEDNYINQKLAKTLIEKAGHQVMVAENGQQAVDLANNIHFDLIFMDVQMPMVDGFEATEQIRASELLCGLHTPIIAMTAFAMQGDRENCLAAGMDDYLSKPIDAKQLYVLLAKYAAESDLECDDVPANLEKLKVSLDGDLGVVQELIKMLLVSYPVQIKEIHDAIEAGDSRSAWHKCHSFRGMLLNFGAYRACQLIKELEELARAQNLTAASQALLNLSSEMERVRSYLDQQVHG